MFIWFNIAEGFVTFNEAQVISGAGASGAEVALCLRVEMDCRQLLEGVR